MLNDYVATYQTKNNIELLPALAIPNSLRWFGHIQRRPPEAPVNSGTLKSMEETRRGRGRPKLTWAEAIKKDLRDWNVPKVLALDRTAWRSAIHLPEP